MPNGPGPDDVRGEVHSELVAATGRARDQLIAALRTGVFETEGAGIADVLGGGGLATASDYGALAAEVVARRDQARADYDVMYSGLLAVQLRGLPPSQQVARLRELLDEQLRRLAAVHQSTGDGAANAAATGEDPDAVVAAGAETAEVLLIEIEAIHRLLGGLDPALLTGRLESLLATIRGTDLQAMRSGLAGADDETRARGEAEIAFAELRLEAAVAEYVRIARMGGFADPVTGAPITGIERSQLAALLEALLADELERPGWDPSIFGWSRFTDPRDPMAAARWSDIERLYAPLAVISFGREPTMRQFHLAVAHAIADRETVIETWFHDVYLGSPDQEWWYFDEWANIGLGTVLRLKGAAGDASVDEVRGRVDRMHREAAAAIAAFRAAAAQPDPALLQQEHPDAFRLLNTFGHIATDEAGRLVYVVPVAQLVVGQVTGVDLPGAAILDVISVRTLVETAVSVYVPELATARLASLGARFGLSPAAQRALRIASDLGAGAVTDAGLQVLTAAAAGKRPGLEILIDALVLGSLSMGTGGLMGEFSSRVVLHQYDDFVVAAVGDLRTRMGARLRTWLAGTLDLSVDALTETGYMALRTDGDVTYDDFLANLIGAAMSRAAASGIRRFDQSVLPDWLQTVDPEALRAMAARGEQVAALRRSVLAEFRAATSGGADAATLFDALMTGRLSWAALKVAYAEKQVTYATMSDIKARRDAFFDVFVPVAIDAARVGIRDQIAALEASRTADPGVLAALRAELTALDATETAFRQEMAMSAEIAALPDVLTKAERKALVDAIEDRYDLAQYGSARVIRPGSGDPTSDIDRSWPTERLRTAAKRAIATAMTGGEGPAGPTTATAFDVNEYNNVMSWIGVHLSNRREWAGRGLVVTLDDGREVALTHAQVERANTLASAMLHMDDAGQRRAYAANFLAADGDVGLAQLHHARLQLAEGAAAQAAAEAEVIAAGMDPDDPDLVLRAREHVYTQRMAELEALNAQIEAETDPQRRNDLIARYERLMNLALREGIETYSSLAGLQLVVIDMQIAGAKPHELMQDLGDFTIEGRLSHLTPEQLRGAVSDQILMIMHHANGFLTGHEDPAATARAFAKYTQRALLIMKITGDYDPADTRHTELLRYAQTLIEHKGDPAGMRAELEKLGGTADQGVVQLLQLLHGLPLMEGVIRLPSSEDVTRYQSSIARLEWMRLREAVREAGGATAEVSLIEGTVRAVGHELDSLDRADFVAQNLASSHLVEDWPEAGALLGRQYDLRRMKGETLPEGAALVGRGVGRAERETGERIATQFAAGESAINAQLAPLRQKHQAAGSPPPPETAQMAAAARAARRQYLTEMQGQLGAELETARQDPAVTRAGQVGLIKQETYYDVIDAMTDPATGEALPGAEAVARATADAAVERFRAGEEAPPLSGWQDEDGDEEQEDGAVTGERDRSRVKTGAIWGSGILAALAAGVGLTFMLAGGGDETATTPAPAALDQADQGQESTDGASDAAGSGQGNADQAPDDAEDDPGAGQASVGAALDGVFAAGPNIVITGSPGLTYRTGSLDLVADDVANQIEFRAVRLLAAADGGGTYLFRFDPGAQQLDALEMDAAGGAATNFERHACIDAMFGDGPPPGEPSFVPPATPFGYDGTEPLFIVADLPATAATANFNVYDVADGGDQYTYWSFVTIAEITEDAAVDVREIPDLAELFADPGGGEGCEVRLVVTPRQVLYEP